MVLTKLDGDARGGAALSVVGVTGGPVMFASTGEKLDDFELFHPDRMASRILDMGDVLTLIEQAEKAFDAEQAEEMAAKLAGRRGLHPRRLPGPDGRRCATWARSRRCSGMLPGMGEMRDQLDELRRARDRPHRGDHPLDDARGARAARRSSTARAGPRIAKGSGVQVSDVNQLLERFTEAQKMMRQMRQRRACRACPGCRACRAGGGKKSRGRAAPPPRKGKAKSGQPGQARPSRSGRPAGAAAGAATPGGAFGLGGQGGPGGRRIGRPRPLDLPPGFEKFLGR